MKRIHSTRLIAGTILVLAGLIALFEPAPAEARGRHGGYRGFVGIRAPAPYFVYYGFYGFGPDYYGYGHPGLYAGREGGIDRNFARLQGWGAVDVDVKPKKAEVWVDGRFVGKAGDFDGYPSYLWLDEGTHHIEICKGGYESYDVEVGIFPGNVSRLKLKLGPGDSEPPKKEE